MPVTGLRRPRVLLVAVLILAVVVMVSAGGIAQLLTDWWWYDAVGAGRVWGSVMATRVVLAVVFGTTFFMILWVNLRLADRLAPVWRPTGDPDDVVERYHQIVAPYANRIRFGVAALFGLVAGLNSAAHWSTWMLFINGGSFGWEDPQFGKDAGFYVFRLPFWNFVVDWLFAAFVFAFFLSIMAHYLSGSLRAELLSSGFRSGLRTHLSGLLVMLALLRAAGYWLDRYGLVLSERGGFTGALATDVNIQLPALNVLFLVSILSAVLFGVNLVRPGWALPVIAVVLWSLTHVVLAGIYPALYQQLRVEPARQAREAEFVERNMAATRFAYRLDDKHLETVDYPYSTTVTDEDLDDYASVLDDVTVVDAKLTTPRFTRNQGEREYYAFGDPLDVDRYLVDGDIEPVVLSVRAINPDGIPNESWENRHVVYTHGNGVVVAAADQVTADSEPLLYFEGVGSSLGPTDDGFEASEVEPYVYYSEDLPGYAIVGADRVDFPDEAETLFDPDYQGGGVSLDSTLRRGAYSLTMGEVRLLFSDSITDDTRILYRRDIRERVRHIAPFLRLDTDPYPVLIEGRLEWVIDAYTTTNRFPYAERAQTETLDGTDLRSGYNYIRNSVKVSVDAYSGDVTLYVVDEDDPVVAAWRRALPDLFTSADEAPEALKAHWRYPIDLFKVQTEMWASYQAPNPVRLIQGNLAWSVAREPITRITPNATTTTTPTTVPGSLSTRPSSTRTDQMPPQYRVTRLPGKDDAEFVIQRAFVPQSGQEGSTERSELTAVMVARSDPGNYGELVLYRLPSGEVPAPELIDAEMRNEASGFITSRRSSTVDFGRMQLVLLDDNLLYVRPLYITDSSGSGVPELTEVLVSDGERIAMAETVTEAVAALVDEAGGVGDAGSNTGGEIEPDGESADDDVEPSDPDDAAGGSGESSVQLDGLSAADLVALAAELLERSEVAESNGRTAEAASLRAEAGEALDALEDLLGVGGRTPADNSGET